MKGPTQTTDQTEWKPQPRFAMAIRLFVLLAPAVSAFVMSFAVARFYPAWKLGVNPWVWWIGVFCAANLYLIWVDRLLSRLLPVATLFRISLVFPDEAPSRFKAALRATNSRSTLKRLQEAKDTGRVDDEVGNSEKLVALVTALSDHDRMTRGHAERVQAYCDLIAEELELSDEDRGKLRWGALLHDMGKLEVPSEILNKAGRPDEDEWKILQGHPAAGRSYVDSLRPWLGDWLGAVDEHHCRWDGNGYPYDLAGADITLAGRIAAVADAYDVMTSVRSYKKAMAPEVARQELVQGAGSQFDPEIVRAFLRVGLGQLRLIAGPLAWVASATGAVPAPVIGPALATVGAAAAVVGGSAFGLVPEPVESLAYVETDDISASGPPLTVLEDESGTVQIEVAGGPADVAFTVEQTPRYGSLGLASSFVAADGSVNWTSTYAPSADFNGEDEMSVSACGSDGQCQPVSIPITVLPVQDPPEARDDYADLRVGTEMSVEPLVNDFDIDGDSLSVVAVSAVNGGTAKVDGDRVVFQAPAQPGRYEVTYVVDDGAGGTSEGIIVFDVADGATPAVTPATTPSTSPPTTAPQAETPSSISPSTTTLPSTTVPPTTAPNGESSTTTTEPTTPAEPSNETPVAVDDAQVTLEDRTLRFNPLANDSDPDNDVLAVASVGSATSGSIVVDDTSGEVLYTPDADFWGTDEFTYTAVDPSGATSAATVLVTVEAVNDPPVVAGFSVDVVENGTGSEVLGTVSASDVDDTNLTFSIVSEGSGGLLTAAGTSAELINLFTIDATSGELRAVSPLDHEAAALHRLTVAVDDGEAATTRIVTVTVLDVNEAPVVSAAAATVSEDASVGSEVATLTSTDPEGDVLAFAIASGNTSGLFAIDNFGVVTVADAIDFEGVTDHLLTITVDDGEFTVDETLAVTIVDVNEPPTASPATAALAEDAPIGSNVATVAASDPEGDVLTYAIVGGDPGGRFAVDGAGVVSTAGALDHESDPVQSLVIEIDDGLNTITETVTVTVSDVNEAPETGPTSATVSEVVPIGTEILNLTAADPEGGALTYVITSGDAAGRLAIDGSGLLTTAAKLDYESHGGFSLTVEIDDGVFTVTETITVNVLDINEPPVTTPASGSVLESAPLGSTVASLTASDPEGRALDYVIVGGDPDERFAIDGSGALTTADVLDFEAVGGYTLSVEITDGVFTVTEIISVTVLDVNESPTVASASGSLLEDVPLATPVATLVATDPEGDPLTYNIVGGDPDGRFTVDVDGAISTAGSLDFETTGSYSLSVEVGDGSNTVATAVAVDVVDVNEAPVASPASFSVVETAPVGTVVGTVEVVDPESDSLTYSITAGDPGSQFEIDRDGVIATAASLDTETTPSYTLSVAAFDGEFTSTATVEITATDINEEPVTSPLSATVAETAPVGSQVGTLSATDPERDRLGFTITAGDPGGQFTINPQGKISVAAGLDFESASSHSLTVDVDDGVHTVTETVTVTVTDENEPPTPASSSATVSEGGTVTMDSLLGLHFDPEGDTITISSVTSGGAFGSSVLSGGSSIAYTHNGGESSSDTITYEVSDGMGNTAVGTVGVSVNPVNDPPVVAATADQSAFVGVAYSQSIATSDPDNSVNSVAVTGLPGGLTYALDGGSGIVTVSGTPTAATLDTTFAVTVTVTDNLGANSAPVTFNIIVDPIGRSPYAGLIAITEVLYAESEPFDVANPGEATLMDEYLEFTNLAGYQIDVENFKLTDTEDPSVATDFQFNVPPYRPQHTGRVNQAFTQPTPLASGQVVTAPIRRPNWTSYQMQDGSSYPAEPWSTWFLGTAYGFPAGENSNWEAFENTGDDLWFWDGDGLLVAFVAWDNGSGDAHIASRPPTELGVWDTTHEGRLAGAAKGRSISLAVNGDNSTSACWELTASGDAAASGCGSVAATRDLDPVGAAPPLVLQGRISSQGQIN